MKAFLLAAGHGTRLRPLTSSMPKCLVPIRGTPMLSIWLAICRRFGIDEVLINLHAHAEQVREFLRERDPGVKVRLSEETELLGSAGTLRANAEWVEGERDFWILYGDVLTSLRLDRMLTFHRRHGYTATIGVYEVRDPRRCGIVSTDEAGLVVDFQEKPDNPASNLAFSGIMVATPSVLANIPPVARPDIGFHLLPGMIGRMFAYPAREYLIDVGTMENYECAQRTWPGISGV